MVTHQHMDHLGLLEILARRSGAEVAALDLLGPYLANFSRSTAADDEFALAVMRRHGVPDDLATVLGELAAAFRAFGSNGHVTRELREGDELEFSRAHAPGLPPPRAQPVGHDLLGLRSRAAAGRRSPAREHLVEPGRVRPLSGDPGQPRPQALLLYMDSMRATRELPARLVLPGHGDPILDHVTLIDDRLRMHRRRAGRILAIVGDRPRTAYEIALRMWGNVAVTQAYLTLSEVLGHLDLLAETGQAVEHDRDGVAVFEALAR